MQLNNAQVVIRPRSPWEAVDLGTHLARQHAGLLISAQFLSMAAVLGVLSLVLMDYPGVVALIFWWLKPLYDRLPLFILSRALFGERPTLKQALRAWPSQMKAQWFANLTWRRFSPWRSFHLPVTQLEGLNGKSRTARLNVLSMRNSQPAAALTVVGMHLEVVLYFSLFALIGMLLPPEVYDGWDIDWSDWLGSENEPLWFAHLSNWLYLLVLAVWEPFYVAGGFTLYLNRRTELEAWDTELTFRRIAERLQKGAAVLLLCAVCLLPALYSTSSLAAEGLCLPPSSEQLPPEERLLNQALTSQASEQAIHALLDEPPFSNPTTEYELKWGEDEPEEEKTTERDGKAPWWLKWLINSWKTSGGIARAFEVLLWLVVLSALTWLLWHYRHWLADFVGRLQNFKPAVRQRPTTLFGLELDSDSLPDDLAAAAEALWPNDPRQALSLLYRGLLVHLLDEHQVAIKNSHTEYEVLGLINAQQLPQLARYASNLTRHWINLAYGHQLPAASVGPALCQAWRSVLKATAPVTAPATQAASA